MDRAWNQHSGRKQVAGRASPGQQNLREAPWADEITGGAAFLLAYARREQGRRQRIPVAVRIEAFYKCPAVEFGAPLVDRYCVSKFDLTRGKKRIGCIEAKRLVSADDTSITRASGKMLPRNMIITPRRRFPPERVMLSLRPLG
jgi:hypothetical protein